VVSEPHEIDEILDRNDGGVEKAESCGGGKTVVAAHPRYCRPNHAGAISARIDDLFMQSLKAAAGLPVREPALPL
jgi:hypothetical protein